MFLPRILESAAAPTLPLETAPRAGRARAHAATPRRARSVAVALVLLVTAPVLGACSQDPGGAVDPYPAPPFQLQDLNPASSTYLETLSTEDASGDPLVLYFASFT